MHRSIPSTWNGVVVGYPAEQDTAAIATPHHKEQGLLVVERNQHDVLERDAQG